MEDHPMTQPEQPQRTTFIDAAWDRVMSAVVMASGPGSLATAVRVELQTIWEVAKAQAAQHDGLREAVQRFVDTAYPNNGEGRTDRLVWMVPESAFGPLRAALAAEQPAGLDVERVAAAVKAAFGITWSNEENMRFAVEYARLRGERP
jgi:hypothetical protein